MKSVMVMELKQWLLFISTLLLSFQATYATEGIGMLEVPDGSISTVDTEIEATIENWGYDRIFVALPEGWTINKMKSGAVKSFAVRETSLWRIYGMPGSGKSMLGRGEVFTGKGFASGYPTKIETTVGGRQGWYLKPNEGLLIDIYVSGISTGGGIIDPLKIEKENPSIRVVKWYESFTLELSTQGWITAPWTVEGAALVESSQAPYSSSGNEKTIYYYNYQEEVADVPAWDEWFDLKNSLAYAMTKTALAPIDLEFLSIEDADDTGVTIKPVWRVDTLADITYAYEWRSYRKVKGITLWRDAVTDIPEWFELF
jgi:hypothetical protein